MRLTWRVLRELQAEYGDAFFILDLDAFAQNYRHFLAAFRAIYPNTTIAYSYKTNYTPRLCRAVCTMGGYAEVVSRMEYELALRVGTPPERIIFNGPYKPESEIEAALAAGATVNVDSRAEADIVAAIARRLPHRVMNVGMRCNFDIGVGTVSRFGLDVDGDEFTSALAALASLENCRVNGFHCHFSTTARTLESFGRRARRLVELSAQYFSAAAPQFINVGGGYFSRMPPALAAQFAFHVPTHHEYAEAVAGRIAAEFPDGTGPELILEPGSALAADTMRFAARIVGLKRIRSKTFALTAGSIHNIKPTLHDKNLPMHVVPGEGPASARVNGPLDVVGYTCMEHDRLYRDYEGDVAVGDFVVFDSVGAYTTVMKPPFIRPCPAIVSFDSASQAFEVIKRPETFDDVFSTYIFD